MLKQVEADLPLINADGDKGESRRRRRICAHKSLAKARCVPRRRGNDLAAPRLNEHSPRSGAHHLRRQELL